MAHLSDIKLVWLEKVKVNDRELAVFDSFSPVVKPVTILAVLSNAITRSWPIRQLDVKNAFLHGPLTETVYMHQPPGFKDKNNPNFVYHLKKSLYGLKQEPRAWFQQFGSFMTKMGFTHSKCDSFYLQSRCLVCLSFTLC